MLDFDYGIVTYKHRFSIKRSLNDYKEVTLDKCISISTEHIYKTVACDKLIFNFIILYRNNDNKVECLKLDSHDWTITINYKGLMSIQI